MAVQEVHPTHRANLASAEKARQVRVALQVLFDHRNISIGVTIQAFTAPIAGE